MIPRDDATLNSPDNLAPVEDRLSGVLKPVRPRTEFINALRGKIQNLREPRIVRRFGNWQLYLLILIATICGTWMLVLFGRFLASLLKEGEPEPTS